MAINNAINQYPIVDALLGTWTPVAGTITSADSILTALQKISGSSVALSGNNVWTGTNSFGNTVTFSTLTASTVPYLDASKNLTSSAVTPTELGYVSGVTSAIQTQLNAKASGSGFTANRVLQTSGAGVLEVSSVTPTQLGYLGSATGTTGTTSTNLVFSASPTFTGTVTVAALAVTGNTECVGKIQIGTTAPTASAGSALTINSSVTTGAAGSGSLILQGESNKERIKIYSAGGAGTGGPLFNMFSFRGTLASPTATQNGDLLAGVSGGGYGATAFSGNQYVFLQYAAENWTDSAMGTYTSFNSVPNGTTGAVSRILIANDGTITFGSAFNTGTGALYAGAGTFTGLLTTVASATGSAGLRIPHGTAPSSPTNGDMWTTTAGVFIRINGVTKTFTTT